ncbi:hypothetical protein ACFPK9_08230 [Rubritalea spongiae]|uniref:Conjugal transfer protein n=1 Tax=Rubritalea spongiae TaxID=430797 RepID=A0ABW5E2G9_9BACT
MIDLVSMTFNFCFQMSQNSPNDSVDGGSPESKTSAISAIPFKIPSKPIFAEDVLTPNKSPKENSGEELKVHHEHTEAISVHDYNTGLQEAFAFREQKKARNKTSSNIAKIAVLVVIIGGGAFWYFSSENQAKVAGAMENTQALVAETKKQTDVSEVIRSYDESLDKIEQHQAKTNEILSEQGVSPSDPATDNAEYQQLLQEVSGTERTAADRDIEVQQKFGGLADKIRSKTGTERP